MVERKRIKPKLNFLAEECWRFFINWLFRLISLDFIFLDGFFGDIGTILANLIGFVFRLVKS